MVDAAETAPCLADTDRDGMPDGWEAAHGLDPLANDATQDADGDSLSNADEYLRATDPADPDSDDDGFADGVEVAAGTDPNEGTSFPPVFTWTGAVDSDWHVIGNWDIDATPGADAYVRLPVGCLPAEHSASGGPVAIYQLTLGGQLTISGGTVTIGGDARE